MRILNLSFQDNPNKKDETQISLLIPWLTTAFRDQTIFPGAKEKERNSLLYFDSPTFFTLITPIL